MDITVTLLTVSQLKERGWTPTLIKRFLGSPDSTKRNPYYRSASPMQFYASDRALACEQTEEWKEAASKAATRSQTGKVAAARRAEMLVAEAETMLITVHHLLPDTLLQRAIAAYNAYHAELEYERGYDYIPASQHSDSAFLERIIVNYIRHELSLYDRHLEELAGRVGVDGASTMIRRRVYAEIAAIYPEYSDECQRQLQRRENGNA